VHVGLCTNMFYISLKRLLPRDHTRRAARYDRFCARQRRASIGVSRYTVLVKLFVRSSFNTLPIHLIPSDSTRQVSIGPAAIQHLFDGIFHPVSHGLCFCTVYLKTSYLHTLATSTNNFHTSKNPIFSNLLSRCAIRYRLRWEFSSMMSVMGVASDTGMRVQSVEGLYRLIVTGVLSGPDLMNVKDARLMQRAMLRVRGRTV